MNFPQKFPCVYVVRPFSITHPIAFQDMILVGTRVNEKSGKIHLFGVGNNNSVIKPITTLNFNEEAILTMKILDGNRIIVGTTSGLVIIAVVGVGNNQLLKLCETTLRFPVTCVSGSLSTIVCGTAKDGLHFYRFLEVENKLEPIFFPPKLSPQLASVSGISKHQLYIFISFTL